MKRSEMVKYLSKRLCESNHIYLEDEGCSNYIEYDELADEILDAISYAGMKPPIINEKSFQLLENGEMIYAVHEWESEDE